MATEPRCDTRKLCSTCAEEIKPDAKKCTKCGSYQDFRRFAVGSGATVSVAAAIVSVIMAVGPRIGVMLIPKEAEPEISLVGATPGLLTLAVRNPGTEPVYVDGAGLIFGRGRSVGALRLEMLQRGAAGVPIEGQATRDLTFLAFGDVGPFATTDSGCFVYLSYGRRSDKVGIANKRVNCVRLAKLGSAAE